MGEKHGVGVLVWPDGRKYEGQWKSDQQHGTGVFQQRDGTQVAVFFWEGKKSNEKELKKKYDGWKRMNPQEARELEKCIEGGTGQKGGGNSGAKGGGRGTGGGNGGGKSGTGTTSGDPSAKAGAFGATGSSKRATSGKKSIGEVGGHEQHYMRISIGGNE